MLCRTAAPVNRNRPGRDGLRGSWLIEDAGFAEECSGLGSVGPRGLGEIRGASRLDATQLDRWRLYRPPNASWCRKGNPGILSLLVREKVYVSSGNCCVLIGKRVLLDILILCELV